MIAAAALITAATLEAQVIRVRLPDGVTSEMIFDGKEVYTGAGKCFECHGNPPWGDLGPSLKDSVWLHVTGSYDELIALIRSGVPEVDSRTGEEMPGHGEGDLSDYQIRSVSAYVWSVSRQKQFDASLGIRMPPSLPAGVTESVIAEGKKIYGGRGLCYLCHGAVPDGGIGPSLSDSTWIRSAGRYEEIVTQIFNGTPREDSKTGVAMPPRGGSHISDDEVRAVAAYIWAISHPESR
jgi:mono/diheme cytochrome c family protein